RFHPHSSSKGLSARPYGKLSDILGRKRMLLTTAALFIVGTAMCALATSVEMLIAGRAVLGIAVGMGSCISPVYISELAEEQHRGKLVNLFVVAIQSGIFISFVTGYLFSSGGEWRVMIGLGIVPAIILYGYALLLPESPRWLVIHGYEARARNILANLYGNAKADAEVKNIRKIAEEEKVEIALLLQPGFIKVILVGIAISFFTQTIGINAINYYAPTIFQTTGFSSPTIATFATMFIGLVLTLSTISSLFFIDKIGRRKPLLFGMLGILFCLLFISATFSLLHDPMIIARSMFIGSVLFMIFHGISIGPACFLIPSEIFPAKIRGLAMGVAVAFNWSANVLVAFLFPIGLTHFGVGACFAIFFAVSIIGWIIFYFSVPETKGLTLEHIERSITTNVKMRHLGVEVRCQND
ncbi:MAG: sugar porter family MFS transporter, partial [Waddliaceae bacterium]